MCTLGRDCSLVCVVHEIIRRRGTVSGFRTFFWSPLRTSVASPPSHGENSRNPRPRARSDIHSPTAADARYGRYPFSRAAAAAAVRTAYVVRLRAICSCLAGRTPTPRHNLVTLDGRPSALARHYVSFRPFRPRPPTTASVRNYYLPDAYSTRVRTLQQYSVHTARR